MLFKHNICYFWLFFSDYNERGPWYFKNRFNSIITFIIGISLLLLILPNILVLIGLAGDKITISNHCYINSTNITDYINSTDYINIINSTNNSFAYKKCFLVGSFYMIIIILNCLAISLLLSPLLYLISERFNKFHMLLKLLLFTIMGILCIYLPSLLGAIFGSFKYPNKMCSFSKYSEFMTLECERTGLITIFACIGIVYFIPIVIYTIYKEIKECYHNTKKEMDDSIRIQDV